MPHTQSPVPPFSRFASALRRLLLTAAAALPLAHAGAQPVVITSATTVGPNDATIAGVPLATADITVRGTTLTINGRHTIRSLVVENNGVVTHSQGFTFDYSGGAETDVVSGMQLSVQPNPTGGDVTVRTASQIDVSSNGYAGGQGPGASPYGSGNGGSYGGRGGLGQFSASIGAVNGSITQPTSLGSGGGASFGGGVVRLTVAGTLTVDGSILSNGGAAGDGGAGGSIWLTCGSLAGVGTIAANGGTFTDARFGGGGGGRVAVYYNSSSFTGVTTAFGGNGNQRGGAGSVFTAPLGTTVGTLIFDNGTTPAGHAESPLVQAQLSGTISMLVVRRGALLQLNEPFTVAALDVNSGGLITHEFANASGAPLNVLGNASIDATSRIDVSFRGYAGGQGPGASPYGSGNGGSHGGRGGAGQFSASIGAVNGSITQPTNLGSGGGASRGGGALRLTVAGTLTVDGSILSNGGALGDGGAGGSIWLTCGSLAGTGTIAANGGTFTDGRFGGGGGGRISAFYDNSSFMGVITAFGGDGQVRGGAGSVYLKPSSGLGTTIYDNGNGTGGETWLVPGENSFDHLIVRGQAVLTHPFESPAGLNITAAGDVSVLATARIDVSSRGYAGGQGPGASPYGSGNGGSYGGRGGLGQFSASIGAVNGSIPQPTSLGSGGGASRGGGAVRLTVAGTLTVDGSILSNGGAAGDGGAGGSIWLTCGSLAGVGTIAANGGTFTDARFGGGGGGRVAVYYASSSFTGVTTAFGGNGNQRGGAGSVFTAPLGTTVGTLTFDNGTTLAGHAESPLVQAQMSGTISMLVVRRGALLQLNEPFTVAALDVNSGGLITHEFANAAGAPLTVLGNASIDATSRIDVSSRGYAAQQGPGASTSNGGNGGSHGGRGGAGVWVEPIGAVNGSVTQPTNLGSGGSTARGGGAVRLTVAGTLTVDGSILSNGGENRDGGAGGSIWLTCGSLAGTGTIAANGGTYTDGRYGGGGGGRIAVYSCNVTVPLSNIRANGCIGYRNGEPGSVYFGSSAINISSQPQSGDYRGGDYFQLSLQATSSNGALSFQWRKKNASGEFIPLTEGERGIFTEVNTNTLFISAIDCTGAGTYDCLVCDSCGCFPSAAATLNVQAPGDFNMDGGSDGTDVDAFFTAWETGDPSADVNLDGGVDGADVQFFYYYWERGC